MPELAELEDPRAVNARIHSLHDIMVIAPGLSHMDGLMLVIPANAGNQRPNSVVSYRKSTIP